MAALARNNPVAKAVQTTFDAVLGSITDLNIGSTQLLQAKNASTDAYSTALAAASLALATACSV